MNKAMRMERFEPVRNFLRNKAEQGAFPGVCAAVGRGDALLFQYARGRLSASGNTQVNENTRFDMASITKMMATAVLALMAVRSGDLFLHTPIHVFFNVPRGKRGITVKHLLTHTSGLPASFLLEDTCDDPASAVDAILAHPLVSPVGGKPVYSCMGYILLGEMIQKIYHRSLDVLSQTLIFEPLGMAHTGYLPKGGNIASTEIVSGEPLTGIVHDENARFLNGVSGNAGVFSTIGDCVRFSMMLACKGAPLLPDDMFGAMVTDYTPAYPQHRGLGLMLQHGGSTFMGTRFPPGSFGHAGFTGTSIAVDPKTKIYGVLLTNAVHPHRGMTDMTRIRRAFYDLSYTCAQA